MSARLSQTEINKNKIDGFNSLQRESKKVYDKIINILKETETKKPFTQDGFCKKIKDQINLIKAPVPIRFWLNYNIRSVWLNIDTNYNVSDYSIVGDSGYGVEYLKKNLYLCSDEDNVIEFSENDPDFKEISYEKYTNLITKRKEIQETFEKEIDKSNKQIPYILR